MKAALLTRPREMVVVDDWPEPAAREGEVIVELTGLGICGSDLELWSGSRPVGGGFPWLIGHEGIGRIVAVGAAVAERRVGERVVIEPNYPCGRCDACLAGRTSTCPNRVIVAINAPGLLQERVAVPAQFAWPAPASVSDADLICTEPLAVARSAVRVSRLARDGDCLIVGAGSQGLLVCQLALALGARVSIVEPQAGRRALAERLGAVAAEPDGTRYPSVFETSGSVGGVRTALELAEPGGTVTLIGIPHDEVTVSFAAIVRDQLEIRGSLIYDHPADFRDTLALLAAGEVAPSRILNGPVPFASVGRALARARDVAGKTWIEYPSGG
ncbi:MAG TPA: alcohol dehydrogenase catalytic domain-containing protein [Solirubrobacteraceae bacterium]|nr:alcohol dehydrogenase catalytic domain-containing protein [Solirubrobacteraceae bacterium]